MKLNLYLMSMLFFVPLSMIALFESQRAAGRANLSLILGNNEIDVGEDDDEAVRNPDCDEDDQGDICVKSFDELCSSFPEYAESCLLRSLMLTVDVITVPDYRPRPSFRERFISFAKSSSRFERRSMRTRKIGMGVMAKRRRSLVCKAESR